MKVIVIIRIILILVAALTSGSVLAHSGSGQPFVLINGDYAKPNPIAGSDPTFAQDFAPANYSVGEKVEFAVDQNVFGAPGYAFRWLWGNKSDFSEGPKVMRTFNQPGTYLVTLQLRNSNQAAFGDIDVVGLNVVPQPNYTIPTSKIAVEQISKSDEGYKIRFIAHPKVDHGAQVKSLAWNFADGSTGLGQTVEHIYKNLPVDSRIFPALRVTDSNGLYTDVIFELGITSKGAVATDSLIPDVVQSSKDLSNSTPKTSNALLIAAALFALALLALLIIFGRRTSNKNVS